MARNDRHQSYDDWNGQEPFDPAPTDSGDNVREFRKDEPFGQNQRDAAVHKVHCHRADQVGHVKFCYDDSVDRTECRADDNGNQDPEIGRKPVFLDEKRHDQGAQGGNRANR